MIIGSKDLFDHIFKSSFQIKSKDMFDHIFLNLILKIVFYCLI